jgi:hypothetical protein
MSVGGLTPQLVEDALVGLDTPLTPAETAQRIVHEAARYGSLT